MPKFWRKKQTRTDPPGSSVIHTVDVSIPKTTQLYQSHELRDPSSSEKVETFSGDEDDLWDEAYKKLKREQPKLFEQYQRCIVIGESAQSSPLGLDTVESKQREQYLASQIEKRLRTIQEQEWSATHDVYRTIVKTVLFAKDYIMQAVSNEPHAALAWAGVSMLLPLLIKPDAQRQAAMEGLAVVSDLILEYRVIEQSFRVRSAELRARAQPDEMDLVDFVQSKIIGLYGQILEFQIRMTRYYSCRGLTRYMRDVVSSDDWQGMQAEIRASHAILQSKLSIIDQIHLDEALEAQRTQFQQFSEQSMPILMSLHLAVSRIENFVIDSGNARLNTTELHQQPRPSSTVPFPRDRDFTTRDEFEQLWRRRRDPAFRVAIVGLGGVGKSQLAIEYAHRIRDEKPGTWVFWAHANTLTRLEESFRTIAEQIHAPGWAGAKANVLEVVSRWLHNEDNGPWVLIIDNVDEKGILCDPWSQQDPIGNDRSLLDYLPQIAHGSILMTSRSHEIAFELTGSTRDVIEVPPMNPDTALSLLRKKLDVGAHEEEEKTLVQSVDFMPLAITQAAALISRRHPRMSVSKYVQELQRGDKERTRLLENNIPDLRRDRKSSNSIIKTWHISFEHIGQVQPSAARLLAFMSCFDREAIPEDLLNKHQVFDFEDDVRMLQDFCLIRMNVEKNSFEMHRLVQFSTTKWLEMRKELRMWQEKYVVTLADVFPDGNYKNWDQCRMLFPHAEAMIPYRVEPVRWATVLYRASWFAREQGWYGKAEQMAQESLETRRAILDGEHPDTLVSMENLALIYIDQGHWKEAEELLVQVVEIRNRVLGQEHPDTLTSLASLASTYRRQGQWKEAEKLLVQVMKTSKRVLGLEHPDTLTSMTNLALTYSDQGRWKEAEELQIQEMEISKRVLGQEHPDTLVSMASLALTYSDQGRWKEAEELQIQEMEISKRVLGLEHPDTLVSMANLASTYSDQGQWKEAEELQIQEMEISKRVLGLEHPDTLTSLANLASTYSNQGRWKEAEEIQIQEMETSKRVLGSEHPDTLTRMQNMAHTLRSQGRNEDAMSLMKRCVQLSQCTLGHNHRVTISSSNTLQNWQA